MSQFEAPVPTPRDEPVWLQPFPDAYLEGAADGPLGPEARYEQSEAISLAFVTALQLLPPRQRAVLILRDVLGFRASEVARILQASEESVTSALKRARATLERQLAPAERRDPPPTPDSPAERELVARLTRAYDEGDVHGVVALLTDDVLLAMPPIPLEYQGRGPTARFLAVVAFREGRTYRLVPTRANGQPAFGIYVRDRHTGIARAAGLQVLTLAGHQICGITRFDNSVLPRFGLPRTLPD